MLAQAYAEVDRVLPGDTRPDYAQVARLEVIERIPKEALRLWPTAPAALHPHAYKPFGNGERACIGRQFAMVEAKIAMARWPRAVSAAPAASASGSSACRSTLASAANAHAPAFNCVVTNVPGSRVPMYFDGAKMVGMYGTGPVFDGMGLINPVYSYGDTIAISFTCDRAMMPDPQTYAAAQRSAFDALKAAAVKPTPAPPVEENDNKPVPKVRARSKGAN